MKRLDPSESPPWPPSNESSDELPVDVTGCEVNGDGFTPGAPSGLEAGAAAAFDVLPPRATFRFLKAISK